MTSEVGAETFGFAGLMVAGLIAFVYYARVRRPHHDDGWATTMGTVLSSTVQVSNNGGGRHETPLVLYAFQVGDRVYQGDKVCLDTRASIANVASDVVNRYPAGVSVVVHYDPTDPARSALEV
jgi:hypothetical protein